MARSSFQKLKLLHVMNYLLQNSDEEHPITVNQMIQYLESNGIAAERKSIYDDNASKFARAFRDVIGVSPREYRAGAEYDSCAPRLGEKPVSLSDADVERRI